MSTPDLSSLLDLSALPEPLGAPIAGVSLAAYLVVEAALLDDLPRATVLAWLGVGQAAFARAEPRFSERIFTELAREGAEFDEHYQRLLAKALSLWSRRVQPLDEHLEAWITYQRHALEAPDPADPGAFARGLGLTPGDELRLDHLWQERLSDPALAARAAESWSLPLAPLPPLTLAPLVFPPREGS